MTYAPRQKSRVSRTGDPLSFRERLESLWASAPQTTIREAMRLTGASAAVTITVRRRLAARGLLKPGKDRTP